MGDLFLLPIVLPKYGFLYFVCKAQIWRFCPYIGCKNLDAIALAVVVLLTIHYE